MMRWQGGAVTEGPWSAKGLQVAIVAARFNAQVTENLVLGAFDMWLKLGGAPADLTLTWVPGAFELPVVAKRLAMQRGAGAPAAVICLGAIIRGDTPHFDYVAGQAASGTMQAGLTSGRPVIFGVLTCDTTDQALARAGLKAGNKGADAVAAAVETARVLARLDGDQAGNIAGGPHA